jgi:hypothetical protein
VVNDRWSDVLNQLRQTNKMVEALIRSVKLVGVDGNRVIVEAPSDLLKGRIDQPSSKSYVEQCISQIVGVSVSVRCVLKGEYHPAAQRPASGSHVSPMKENDQAKQSATGEVAPEVTQKPDTQEDPMVEEALSLGAQVKNVD